MGTIAVAKRSMLGRNACKQVRHENDIPGIIYGLKKDIVPIQFSKKEFLPLLREKILKLTLEDKQEDVMIKEIQFDTFGEKILHVDFFRIDMTKKITVSIPLRFVGTPKGVQHGGIWSRHLNHIEISCLPTEIPECAQVFVENLEIGQSLRVKDIQMPVASAILKTDPEIYVTAVQAPKTEEAGTPAAAESAPESKAEPELIKKPKEETEPEEK